MGPGRTNDIRGLAAAMRLTLLATLLVGASLLASGCGASADPAAADAPKQHGGTITVGMDQEPQCMNRLIQCGSMTATTMIWDSIFDVLVSVDAKGDYAPSLAVEVPTRENGLVRETPGGGMDVQIAIKPAAHWSDNTPITCEDIQFTFDTQMDERWMVISRKGWDLVKSVDCLDQRTAVYHFKERYAPYLGIAGSYILPKHVLDGKDFNTFLNDSISIASGPYEFDHWDRAVSVTLKRNPHYWNKGADDRPWVDHIRYVFVADSNTLKIQLRTGEVDVISPPPDSTLKEELKTFPRASFQIEPSVYWEQIAFNTAKAPTNDVNVRQAIAYSIDRDEIARIVLKGQVKVLDSTLLPAKEEYYIPAWAKYKPDAKHAAALLEKSGWKKDGKYYAKNGKPLTVVFKSTAGNNLRLKVAQLLQQRLKANGIKMEIALEPPNVFFGQSALQGAFDMALWAWSSGIDPSQRTLFSCDSIPTEANDYEGQNNYRYCNERVTELLTKSDVTTSAKERAGYVHEIQTLMAKDMPMLPLFQRPETLAYANRVQGMDDNPLGGFVWNVADWAVAK
ncbi:MAG: extracellular solute-binding protein family 5 [Thermoleophilia bacterium]|nr:extracellular solute-binding protein family 5 [Thermoleophilia bacterium]